MFDEKKYMREYSREYRKTPEGKAIMDKALRTYLINNPWSRSFSLAKQRCKKNGAYGKRRIKFKLTMNEVSVLWFIYKAYLMKKPSIDRINTEGNYEFKNCRFIELSENKKRKKTPMTEKTKKKISKIKKKQFRNIIKVVKK